MLSLGGRLILVNSFLSAIPLYYIALYKIPIWVVNKLDAIRRNFIWSGSGDGKKKYCLVSWKKSIGVRSMGVGVYFTTNECGPIM